MDCIKRAMAMARAMALSSCITIVHYEYSQYILSMAYCHFSPKFKSTGVEKKKLGGGHNTTACLLLQVVTQHR